ncbi:MAG: DoxX family protein [Chthoniobacteraceae bacterium]
MNLVARVRWLYETLIRFGTLLQSPVLLVMRLYWGWSFFQTGKGKLGHLDDIAEYFTDLNIPFPKFNAILAGSTECIGGLLLLIGLASRLVSIPLIVIMLIAYWTADREALTGIFEKPDAFLEATPFLFLLTCIFILSFGPGMFSIDWLLGKKLGSKPRSSGS